MIADPMRIFQLCTLAALLMCGANKIEAQILPMPPGSSLPAPPALDPKIKIWNYSTINLVLYKRLAGNGGSNPWQFVEHFPKHSFASGAGDGKKLYATKTDEQWCFGANINGAITLVKQVEVRARGNRIEEFFAVAGVEKPKVNVWNYSGKDLFLYKRASVGFWQFVEKIDFHKFDGPSDGKKLFPARVGEEWCLAIQRTNNLAGNHTIRRQIKVTPGWNRLDAYVDIDSARIHVSNYSNGPLVLYHKKANSQTWNFHSTIVNHISTIGGGDGKHKYFSDIGDTWCLAQRRGNRMVPVKQITVTDNGSNELSVN
ncbi:MAG: hypothetical protein P1U89_16960 [Verrucomicrobiales bacterium]|nr:hypothetical protein [Verrucomicrobiales bacterium]